MKNMRNTFLLLLVLIGAGSLWGQVPAFPGAEGGGMYTTGGRGGAVYYVNTLEDDENLGSAETREGSLRWCINRSGPRTILFKVSGTIMLKTKLAIRNGDVTIAGQSASGGGVCIGNYPVSVNADNVIIRYLRFRMGDDTDTEDDALGGRFFTNVIVDHCSMSWSTDECVSFYNCDYFTLQWCIISESLRMSSHEKGAHGYGGIWGGTNATFHHNLLAHHDSRTPRFGPGQNIPPHVETVDHRNNVNYNHGNTYGGEGMNINIVNNYYKPGPASSTGAARGRIMSFDMDTNNEDSERYLIWGQLYVDGNVVDDGTNEQNCINATNDNWTYGVYNQFPSKYGTVSQSDKDAMRMDRPFEIKALYNDRVYPAIVTTHDARTAYEKVLDYAGASKRRDTHDSRIIKETRNETTTYKGLHPENSGRYPKPGIIDSHWDTKPSDAEEDWIPWPILSQGAVPVDSDGDGIPDGWLDLNYPGKTATDLDEEGHTYLEVYLNSLVEDITKNQNLVDDGTGIRENLGRDAETLEVYYDKNTGKIVVDASQEMESVALYTLTGSCLLKKPYNGKNTLLDISAYKDIRFFIVKVVMEDKTLRVAKILI